MLLRSSSLKQISYSSPVSCFLRILLAKSFIISFHLTIKPNIPKLKKCVQKKYKNLKVIKIKMQLYKKARRRILKSILQGRLIQGKLTQLIVQLGAFIQSLPLHFDPFQQYFVPVMKTLISLRNVTPFQLCICPKSEEMLVAINLVTLSSPNCQQHMVTRLLSRTNRIRPNLLFFFPVSLEYLHQRLHGYLNITRFYLHLNKKLEQQLQCSGLKTNIAFTKIGGK